MAGATKNDPADAAAICEAVGRPSMRFVPIKTLEQQSETVTHKSRELSHPKKDPEAEATFKQTSAAW